MNLNLLKEPFPAHDISWRVQSCGKKNNRFWAICLAYIDARNVMDRLDDVCGPENWKVIYRDMNKSFLCGLSIRVNDKWVTKWDGAGETDIEKIKGGISDSFKRAGVCWGIGRYLYSLEGYFAVITDDGIYSAKTKDGEYFKWTPPLLPEWALPKSSANVDAGKKSSPSNQTATATTKQKKETQTGPKMNHGFPTSGTAQVTGSSNAKLNPSEIIKFGTYKNQTIFTAASDPDFAAHCEYMLNAEDAKPDHKFKDANLKKWAALLDYAKSRKLVNDDLPF